MSTSVMQHPLQDGPQNVWPPKLIASMIAREAKERKADMVRHQAFSCL